MPDLGASHTRSFSLSWQWRRFWSLGGKSAPEWSDVEIAEKGLEQVVPPLQQMTHVVTPYDHSIGMAADDTAIFQQTVATTWMTNVKGVSGNSRLQNTHMSSSCMLLKQHLCMITVARQIC